MINIFSTIIGSVLYCQLICVLALLKPIKEPYYIRNVWCNFQETHLPPKILGIFLFALFLNTFMDMSWEKTYHGNLLAEVEDPDLVMEFYVCKIAMSYTCFFVVVFLLILIERISATLITIARLLEFELMCRHAILTRENATQVYRTVLVLTNLFDVLKTNDANSSNLTDSPKKTRFK